MRTPSLVMLAVLMLVLAACGDTTTDTGPGSPGNPVAAHPTPVPPRGSQAPRGDASASAARSREPSGREGAAHGRQKDAAGSAAAAAPGYRALLERQSPRPKRRFTPCNLVTRAEASAIVDAPMPEPLEAPQGPTCIYRPEASKSLITVAVQALEFDKLKKQIRRRRQVSVVDRTGYCGALGQPMLYVPLSAKRVLTIAAPCTIARQFAAKAVPRLTR